MGRKQEELKAIVHQENYHIVVITETWWDSLHDWSTSVDGYKLFRRDKLRRIGSGAALYVRKFLIVLRLIMAMTMLNVYG